jgi:hypothetical protein
MTKYFAVCPEDGSLEWMDLKEDERGDVMGGVVNSLQENGEIQYSNKYMRLKDKKYLDLICRFCECPVIIIPFDVCDEEKRKEVFKMSPSERIQYARKFEIVESLDD